MRLNMRRYNKNILQVFSRQIFIRQNKINRITNLFTLMNINLFVLKKQVDDDNHLQRIESLEVL